MKKTLLISILFVTTIFAQVEKKSIAILDFMSNGVSQSEAIAITERLRSELFRLDTFAIYERGKMIEIMNEQGFQQSICTTSDGAVEIGKLIGVKMIVTGSINSLGDLLTISTRIINVESGKIEKVTDFDCNRPPIGIFSTKKSRDGEALEYIMKSGMLFVAKQLVGKEPDYKMKQLGSWIHIAPKKKDN